MLYICIDRGKVSGLLEFDSNNNRDSVNESTYETAIVDASVPMHDHVTV